MVKEKILAIEEIKFDVNLYPRNNSDWMTSYHYAEAMKAGASFPPIIVAFSNGEYILVDGKHRIDAYIKNKEKHVQVVILRGLTYEQIYAEAIKANIAHGRVLSKQEIAKAIVTLEQMKYDTITISQIVHIPADKLKEFVTGRLVSSITGEQIVVKAPLQHLVDFPNSVSSEQLEGQNILASRDQLQLINELIFILKNQLFDETLKENLKELKIELNKLEL